MTLDRRDIIRCVNAIDGMKFTSGKVPGSSSSQKELLISGHPDIASLDGIPERYHLRIITGIHALRTLVSRGHKLDYFQAQRVWNTTDDIIMEPGIEVFGDNEEWLPSMVFIDHDEVVSRCQGPLDVITAVKLSQDGLADYLAAKYEAMTSGALGLT